MKELEKRSMPEDEVPSKLNALCKLCGSSRMIPDSLKLRDDFELLKMMEYTNPAQMFQSTLKGRQVAVKIIRLYVPLRDEEPLTVSTQPLLFASVTFVTSHRGFAKKLWLGNTSATRIFSRSSVQRCSNTRFA